MLRGTIITFDEVMREPLPSIDWLVEGILANGDRAVFYAEFGAFKTWSLIDLGLHIAAAHPWLQTYKVPKPKTVLYVDEEMNRRELWRRMQRLGRTLDVDTAPFTALSHHGVRLDREGAKSFLEELRQGDRVPEVLIIDALRRVLVGDESAARDVSEFWRALEVLRDTGMTVLIAHHMRKASRNSNASRDRFSGSTDILAGADTAYAIQRVPPDTIKIECVKARSIPEPAPFGARLYDDGPDSPAQLRYVQGIELAETLGAAQRLVLECLRNSGEPMRTRHLIRHLSGSVAERSVQRALPRLAKLGMIQPIERGVWRAVGVARG
jgi:hypothetical protein